MSRTAAAQQGFYILEVIRGRFPFDTLKRKVMEVKRRYGSSTLLIEDSPISRGLIQSLKEQSINVTVYKPDTDKRGRVIAQTDLFAGGSVRFPRRAAWLEDFIAELLAFPGRHDDQVDALTKGLAWGRTDGVGYPSTPSLSGCTDATWHRYDDLHRHHANSVQITSQLRPDMIFGKDRRSAIERRRSI